MIIEQIDRNEGDGGKPSILTAVSNRILRGRPVSQQLSVALLVAGAAVLYLWDLGASGWANSFYSAAVQAGSRNWEAMLFGSVDPANTITVDKIPAALWIMDISARIFGFNVWSVLVPQAMEGAAAVALTYATVRRVIGHAAGLLAGAVLAFTPVAALMFRYNNPDALLVLFLISSAYCLLRALEKDASLWWLPWAGILFGFGFLTKMMQVLLVLPAFVIVFLIAAPTTIWVRLRGLVVAGVAALVAGGWYPTLAYFWPFKRPYIGGSQHDSIFELAFGYNGIGRLTGREVGGLGNPNFDTGPLRLFDADMGGQIAWLFPAALLAGAGGLWITRHAARTDIVRAALLLWTGWLLTCGIVFSFASGIVHPYYTVALAPAIACSLAIGQTVMWRQSARLVWAVAATMAAVTALLAYVLLSRVDDWMVWLRPAVVFGGGAAAILLLVAPCTHRRLVALLAFTTGFAGPVAYTLSTIATPHSGEIVLAGPVRYGTHGTGPQHSGPVELVLHPAEELIATIGQHGDQYTWVAATVTSPQAAVYQLATGYPIMGIGGYNGTDPAPTMDQFRADVAGDRIHWFIPGPPIRTTTGEPLTGSDVAIRISAWVTAHFTPRVIGGIAVYDLTQNPANPAG